MNVFSLLFPVGVGVGAGVGVGVGTGVGVGCGCDWVVVAGVGVGLGVGLFFTGLVDVLGVVVALTDGARGNLRASLCQRQLAAVMSLEETPCA